MKNRIKILFITLLLPVCLFSQTKPNIILIMADDLGYETLGCNGNDDLLTPELDKLALTGMRFEHCYSTPLCTPSRVQLMTGKYNHRNYIGFGLLDPKEITFGHIMRSQGYKTCIAGKWQLFGNAKQRDLAGGKIGTLPQAAGFDSYCLWQVDTLGSRYADPVIYLNPGVSKFFKGEYGPDLFTRHIERFIDENASYPFFIYYPMVLTHDPFEPTPFSKSKGKHADLQNYYFKDMVQYMDYLVGRIIKKTEELGIRENTVIMFTGDNGTSRKIVSNYKGGERNGNKGNTDERGTRVPLIVNWKGISKSGSVNRNLIDFTDFLPTLLDFCGGTAPKNFTLDGISFHPQLVGRKVPKREWVFCHYDPRWGELKPATYVHDKELKVYQTGEIYNLLKDPDEKLPLNATILTARQKRKSDYFTEVIKKVLLNPR